MQASTVARSPAPVAFVAGLRRRPWLSPIVGREVGEWGRESSDPGLLAPPTVAAEPPAAVAATLVDAQIA